MSMVPYTASSLASALAAGAGAAMRDVEPDDVIRAVRKIQGAYRRTRRRYKALKPTPKKRKTGSTSRLQPDRPNTVPATSLPPDTGAGATLQEGVLYNDQLVAPTFNSNNVGDTDTMTMHVKGYKICRHFYMANRSLATTTDVGPAEIHWALIQWKCPISSASVDSLLPLKFFRANYYNDKKAEVFGKIGSPSDAYATPGDPWEMKLNCLAMNPNNGYNILQHRKKTLFPNINGDFKRQDMWKIEYYQKIDRIMELEEKGNARFKYPIHEVWWYNAPSATYHSANTVNTNNIVKTNVHNTCYFNSMRG